MLWCVNSWARMWGEGTHCWKQSRFQRTKAAYSPPWKTSPASVPTLVIKKSDAQPGTRTEFKIIPQRLNFIPIHQHELDLQTLRQLSLNIMTHRSVIYFFKKKKISFSPFIRGVGYPISHNYKVYA